MFSNPDDQEGISCPWIKASGLPLSVGKFFPDAEEPYLWRSDIQCLAWAILKLEWSPLGSLFDHKRGEFSRLLLCAASTNFKVLLEATITDIQPSCNAKGPDANLNEALKIILPMASGVLQSDFSRQLHKALFDLERVLPSKLGIEVPYLAIEIAFLTSATFRNFVHQAIVQQSKNTLSATILTLQADAGQLLVTLPNKFSGKVFALHFDEVFHSQRVERGGVMRIRKERKM